MVKKSLTQFSPNGEYIICDPSLFSLDFSEINDAKSEKNPYLMNVNGHDWLFVPTHYSDQECPIFYGDGEQCDITTSSGLVSFIPKKSLDDFILRSISNIKGILMMELNGDLEYRGLDIKSDEFVLLTGR